MAQKKKSPWDLSPFGGSTQEASQSRTSEQRQNATFDTRNLAAEDNSRDLAAAQGQAPLGMVDPNDYKSPWISGSNEWYGKINQLGAQSAGNDPSAFWNLYGSDVQGWQPGGNAASFMANTFDPMAMGQAMYGSADFSSLEETLGGSTAIANALNGGQSGNAMFVDPAMLVGNVMQALASGDPEKMQGVNPALRAIVEGATGNPALQTENLINFFSRALGGSMPQDILRAFLGTIQRLGSVWMSDLSHGPMNKLDNTSFARFLTQRLGPTLGL